MNKFCFTQNLTDQLYNLENNNYNFAQILSTANNDEKSQMKTIPTYPSTLHSNGNLKELYNFDASLSV